MKVTLDSTTHIVDINNGQLQARLWEGKTDGGIPVAALVIRIGVHVDADQSQFEHELKKQLPPATFGAEVFPLRMFLP
jgi:hypothetical protein